MSAGERSGLLRVHDLADRLSRPAGELSDVNDLPLIRRHGSADLRIEIGPSLVAPFLGTSVGAQGRNEIFLSHAPMVAHTSSEYRHGSGLRKAALHRMMLTDLPQTSRGVAGVRSAEMPDAAGISGGLMVVERSPGDHGMCATHRRYQLTCDQYEELVTECGNRCQLCGFPGPEMPYKRLYIDHDFRGTWAVRGLLCIRCNSALGDPRIKNKPDGVEEYLANAWFLRMLKALGVSDDPTVEPPDGAVIENQYGVLWTRNRAGEWVADRNYNGHAHKPRQWRDLFRDYGPHNLRVVPPEELTSRSARANAKRVYASIRIDDLASCARSLRRRMSPEHCQALARLLLEE